MLDESNDYNEYCYFPRQSKRESSKYSRYKANTCKSAITTRNILQKEKQSCDKLIKNYRTIKRNEKQEYDDSPRIYYSRIYYCANCKRETNELCECNYIYWCGKECEWDNCYQTKLLGVQDIILSLDILCNYHTLKYYEYFEKEKNKLITNQTI